MQRRQFLKFFSAGIAGLALDQAIPFGRVWSFPKEIVIFKGLDLAHKFDFSANQLRAFEMLNRTIDKWQRAPRFWYRDHLGRIWLWPEDVTKPIQVSSVPDPESFTAAKFIDTALYCGLPPG
jgi:hypothetical protein